MVLDAALDVAAAHRSTPATRSNVFATAGRMHLSQMEIGLSAGGEMNASIRSTSSIFASAL